MTSQRSKGRKKLLHIFSRTAQKNGDDVIKHQEKARVENHLIQASDFSRACKSKACDQRQEKQCTPNTIFPLKFWRLRHFCTFSSVQSSVSQRAQVWQDFPTCHLLRPRLHVHSTSICLQPFNLTNSETATTIALHTIPISPSHMDALSNYGSPFPSMNKKRFKTFFLRIA